MMRRSSSESSDMADSCKHREKKTLGRAPQAQCLKGALWHMVPGPDFNSLTYPVAELHKHITASRRAQDAHHPLIIVSGTLTVRVVIQMGDGHYTPRGAGSG